MKLGDRIRLHIERKRTFDEGKDVTDGEFIVSEISSSLPHCFAGDCWSGGFTHFSYASKEDGKPDIVLKGSIYMPSPSMLDEKVMKDLHYDKKIVSWEVL